MQKRKNVEPAELALELKANAPQNVRAFVVKEDIVNAIVGASEHKVVVSARHDDYGFRNWEDIKTKMNFLEQAWSGYVRIWPKPQGENAVEITFSRVH